jgi:HSP20 family protein
MSVIRRPPRTTHLDLALLQREVNQLFERLADVDRSARPPEGDWVPNVDIYECRGKLHVVAEVPGVPPDSLRVVFRDGHLLIAGERREPKPAGTSGFLCVERPQGRFTRVVLVDMPVDVREAEARLEGGVLTVALPRLKDRRGRETVIPVKREDA